MPWATDEVICALSGVNGRDDSVVCVGDTVMPSWERACKNLQRPVSTLLNDVSHDVACFSFLLN